MKACDVALNSRLKDVYANFNSQYQCIDATQFLGNDDLQNIVKIILLMHGHALK